MGLDNFGSHPTSFGHRASSGSVGKPFGFLDAF